MKVKKLIFIGDTFTRGDGAEWPSLYTKLGALPKEYKSNAWQIRLRKEVDDFTQLANDFSTVYGPMMVKNGEYIIEQRKNFGWAKIVSKHFNLPHKNYSSNFKSLGEYLPFLNYHSDDDLKDCLVVAGVLPIIKDLTFNHSKQTELRNITVPYFASQLLLLKEYVENRGGIFVYFHTQDFPDVLYDPNHNPFLLELRPLLLLDGHIENNIGHSFRYRRFDGIHYDVGGQKVIADIIVKQLESSDFVHIFR
jgi:hypothetical protein